MQGADLEKAFRQLFDQVGEDSTREALIDTPKRFGATFLELCEGYGQDPGDLLRSGLFSNPKGGMVVVKDLGFYSLCEHHLLPFFGSVSLAYLPKQNVVGLSRLAKLVHIFSRRLQIQERFTSEIAEAIDGTLDCEGVGILVKARHLCMSMRSKGESLSNESSVLTTHWTGAFKEAQVQNEFFSQIRQN